MTDLRIESIDGSRCAFDMDFDTATFKWKIWYYDCFFIYYLSNRNRTMRQISMIRYWQSGKLAWCIYKNTLSHYDCHRILGIVCSFCVEIFRAQLRHSTFNKWSVDSKGILWSIVAFLHYRTSTNLISCSQLLSLQLQSKLRFLWFGEFFFF